MKRKETEAIYRREYSRKLPGDIQQEDFLQQLDISQNRLGAEIGVCSPGINKTIHGKRFITDDTALRLSKFFGNSASFWLGLQMNYDLDVADDALASRINKEVHQLAIA